MNDSCHSSDTAITEIRNGVGFMAQSICKVNFYIEYIEHIKNFNSLIPTPRSNSRGREFK